MFKLIIDKSPNFDDPDYIFESDIAVIVEALKNKNIAKNGIVDNLENSLIFESNLTTKEIKELLKENFSDLFENIRFKSLQNINV